MGVQLGVLELPRRIGIDEDTRRAVLDYEVASKRFVLDGVVPGSVDRRMGAGGDSESCSRTSILTNDEFDDGPDCFRRECEHARSMRERPRNRDPRSARPDERFEFPFIAR
jgi:hypothetical protein